jgi:hypothetical protein
MRHELYSPATKKIVSYPYRYSTLFENLSEGMQKQNEGVFWLILNDKDKTLVPLTRTMHQGKSCYICDIMPGTFTNPQALAKSYDEQQGNMLPTFESLKYLDEQ